MAFVDVEVTIPSDEWGVTWQFLSDPHRWLPLPAVRRDGGWLTTVRGGPVLQQVIAELGEPVGDGRREIRELRWRPTDRHGGWTAEHLLPGFVGALVLEQLEPCGVRLILRGRYTPPGGPVGRATDVAAMRGVARVTIRRFVEEVVDRLRTGDHRHAPGG